MVFVMDAEVELNLAAPSRIAAFPCAGGVAGVVTEAEVVPECNGHGMLLVWVGEVKTLVAVLKKVLEMEMILPVAVESFQVRQEEIRDLKAVVGMVKYQMPFHILVCMTHT